MNIIKLLVIGSVLYSPQIFADPVIKINLRLKALIIDQSCVVAAESQNMNVALGTWGTKNMLNVGDRTRSMPFSIKLIDCKADAVSVSFVGQQNTTDKRYLALNTASTAKNVAIEILDKNRQTLALGDFSAKENIKNTANIKLDFYANYVSTLGNVTAGTANSVANFILAYD